ncbi:SH3 and multiple ankyrin repeat domains protein 2-like isoform X2 [Mytilus californianus]|uniref:SH3 and multiple ankyrin repeat domains protein 2-like isoform X2 n=1 Tax=Mytilus californianus TaxID=6549 RepID=UPI002247F5E3|nr:SH3 and multiple ankyrin repeat domains protein 2-like isoform X2 [Mytilus californianus]
MTVTMSKFHTSPTRHYNGPQDYQNGGLDEGDVSFISGSPAHGYNDENQTGTVFIRISIPELKIQKCLQFELDETVWHAKQRLLTNFPEDLRDSINYGLYMPPMNGRAGKFLDEERFLSEYPLQGPIGFLEFKHKKRVYKLMHVNPRKLKQLHTKSYLKSFLECVKSGNVEKVTKMTNKGLDPNFHDHSTGETPLTIACLIKGGKCREIVLTLVGGGGHLDYRNKKGMTALHKAVLVKNPTAVKVLLDLGLSPNMKDARCLTPLYYGIAHNSDPAITEMLLQERAVIGSQDEQGWFEIHHACKQGLLQHLEHLLFYGADMDVQNAGGNTAIHICAINNQESCLRVLLFRGANKDVQNYQNQSAFQVAVISGNQSIADILHKHKSDDIVQYREVPKYSVRRRDSVASAAMFALSRSRSDPRINLIMAEGRYISPSNSTQSFSHLDNISSPSRDYSTDSPRSMSISSTSSGPVSGTGDNGMWEGRANGQEGFFPYHHVQEVRLRKAGSCGDILRESTLQRNTLASIVHTYSDYAPRTVVLQRGPEGYGFILRGAKSQSTRNGELDFHPTPEFPALQYLDSVDPSSRADRAGLKPGDFILEINGENVVRASHDRVVQVIRNSGDTLAMKVVTVRPQQNPVNWQHMDGTMTLPSRTTNSASGSKKQAPQPPRRDPRTSLSKEKGRQLAEGLNELGNEEQRRNDNVIRASGEDQLDLALAEFERENLEQHNVTTEQKTASIRAKHASKRVSCVDLSNIEGYDSEKSDHRSPSERIIHKYNNERKQSAMERSQSTPDLSDKKPEPVYATPVVPGSAGVQRRNDGTYVYAVPEDSLSMKSSTSTSERPKGPPPPPPGALGFKRPAPGVPKDEEVVQPSNTEVVSINTIGSRTSLYARPEKLSTAPQDDFESSFRPGASAKMTDEPKVKSKAHQRNSSLTSTNSGGSRQSDDKHSVSFAEDKVLDNAKTYLQKHPNAKLLVTADVHSNVKKQTGKYEPEPDYDLEDDKVKSRVTVISIGDRKTTDSEAKRYSVRSDIPAGNIPPPPSEPAPNPPTKTLAPGQQIAKSSAPQPAKAAAPQPSTVKSAAPKPPSPKSKTPSPKVEQKIVTQKKEEVKIENIPSAPAVPPMPPAAPPPPPAPPLPPAEPPAPPLPKSQPPAQTKQSNTTPQGIEANDLLAAVRKRQQRMDVEGPKISALPESKDGPQKDDNQAAIIAAVARRRRMLEEKGDTSVIDAIETKLQKTKKLQSAKLAFSSDNIGKTPEMKPKVAKPVEPKAIVNDVKSSMERQPPKVDIKPIKSVTVKGKEPTKIMSTVNGGAVKTPVKMEVKADTKTTDSNKAIITSTPKTENKENSVSSPRGKDYVALAEKARQEYLQKKASQTSLRVTATNNSPNTVSKPADRSKSPAKTIPTSPLIAQSTTNSSKVPIRDQNKNIITTGVQSDRTKVFSSVSQIPNGNVKNMSSKNKDNGVSSLKPAKDIGVISQNKTSIKDRIASINKAEQSKGNVNGKVPNEKLSVKGVTVESSGTDKSSLPPPPEFGDSVQLEIIPPPMGFDSGSNFSDISRQSSVFNQDDNESLVSSVSTVSTLSDDQADSGYGRQRHNYEELIAPPPPGFGDSNSNQGYETIPSVIPPPPSFGEEKRDLMNKSRQVTKPFSSKSVDNWQCLDVLDWLDSLKLSQYKTSFQQKCIDGKRLQNLSRNDYLDLGVTQVGHRMNLERSIKKLNLPKNVVSSSHL